MSFVFVFRRRLQDVFIKTNIFTLNIRLQKTFSRCLQESCSRPVYSSWPYVFKTSSMHLKDVFWRRLPDVFKTFLTFLQDVFKTYSRRLEKMFSRRFQDVSSSYTAFVHTSSRSIQHVSETYCKDGYLYRDLPRSHFWEIYGQCTKFSSFSFSLYYTF